MKTIVFFRNLTLSYWICFAIFLDLRIIQAFDLYGGNHPSDLKALDCWFHKMMRIAGKKLNPAEWCLYGTRPLALCSRHILTVVCTQFYSDCVLPSNIF
jgi:hypothetical protein